MQFPPALLVLPAAVVLASTSFAQVQLSLENAVPWPSSVLGSPNVLNRTVAVDASGDGHLDLFVRGGADGDKILYFDGVWRNLGALATGISCADFDATHGSTSGASSALAFVDGTGLRLLQRNAFHPTLPTTLSFSASSIDTAPLGPWAGARLVRAGDLDATGSIDYVGVKADGQTLILRANGGPTNVEFDVGRTILDVVILQWMSSPAREIAVLTHSGVEMRLGNGAPCDALGISGFVSTAMAALPVPGAADRLAWVGSDGVISNFALFRRAGTQIQDFGTLATAAQAIHGLTTGDVDGDGDTDVVVRRANSAVHWLLENAGPATFSPSSKVDVTWTSAMTNSGPPVLAEFSNDGVAELVVPAYDSNGTYGAIACFAAAPIELVSRDVFLFEDELTPTPVVKFLSDEPPTLDRELRFEVNFADEDLPYTSGTDDRRIEVSVFVGSPTTNNVSMAMESRYWIPYPQTSIVDTRLFLGGIVIPVPSTQEDAECDLAARFLEVRQIRVDNGWIVESMPVYTFGIVVSNDQVVQYSGWGDYEICELTTGDDDPIVCSGNNVGGYHASALTRRRKPLPVGGPIEPVPAPLPSGTASTTP